MTVKINPSVELSPQDLFELRNYLREVVRVYRLDTHYPEVNPSLVMPNVERVMGRYLEVVKGSSSERYFAPTMKRIQEAYRKESWNEFYNGLESLVVDIEWK